MGEELEVSGKVPASPAEIYVAWLEGDRHTAMTGGPATGSAMVGTSFSAWDGYINGTNLELDPYRRIVQAWRTSEFPDDAPDSRLEVLLTEEDGGTRVTIRQTEIPSGQASHYETGWHEHYFEPMAKYFGGGVPVGVDEVDEADVVDEAWTLDEPEAAPAPKAKAAAKKPAKKPAKKMAAKAKPAAKAKSKAKAKAKPAAKKPAKKMAAKAKAKPAKKPAKKAAKAKPAKRRK